jgi:dihydroorotate dehydrogenase
MNLRKPWLFLPSKLAHDLSPYGLELYSLLKGSDTTPVWNPYSFKGLVFKNPLGIAGGVDKNADHLEAWRRVGCGFIEVGTVTPRPQDPNPGLIMNRDAKTFSVWNKMGFPSEGASEVYFNIKKFKSHASLPVFVNIGKNRTTENVDAHKDYSELITHFADVADAFVVNISSPNTKGLRDLATLENFNAFISPIRKHYDDLKLNQPLFLKLSPDLDMQGQEIVLRACIDHGFDGFVLTNTTLDRTHTPFYPNEGGVSGKPLKEKSIQALMHAKNVILKQNQKKCLISVGGVMTAEDVFERIKLGADLVQVYSTLVFEGPGFFRKVSKLAGQQSGKENKSL